MLMLAVATILSVAPLGGTDSDTVPVEQAAELTSADAPMLAQATMDLMPIADTNRDGRVSAQEYRIFSESGWNVVAQGGDEVVLAELDQMSQMAFVGIVPNADGVITRQMYLDAIPQRFRLFDQNADSSLDADELNGRAFSAQAPPNA